MSAIRVLIADDYLFIREALEMFLERSADVSVVATVADGEKAVTACEQHQPHLALLDYRMEGSIAEELITERHMELSVTRVAIDASAAHGPPRLVPSLSKGPETCCGSQPALLRRSAPPLHARERSCAMSVCYTERSCFSHRLILGTLFQR